MVYLFFGGSLSSSLIVNIRIPCTDNAQRHRKALWAIYNDIIILDVIEMCFLAALPGVHYSHCSLLGAGRATGRPQAEI